MELRQSGKNQNTRYIYFLLQNKLSNEVQNLTKYFRVDSIVKKKFWVNLMDCELPNKFCHKLKKVL